MERLAKISLTLQDKQYLKMKCRDGVCQTRNGHECYLGIGSDM